MATSSSESESGRRWVATAWGLLGLVIVSLVSLAVFLLFRINLFTSEPLGDEKIKSLWAFLGVALGAVATIVAALLTEQHNRRADRISSQAENRLTLDTRTKVLELITEEGKYAPRARLEGAVATMMELHGGPIAIRILGHLWSGNHIGTTTALWLIDQILDDKNTSSEEKTQAILLLSESASKLLSEDTQWYGWPNILDNGAWPSELSETAKIGLLMVALNVLTTQRAAYWEEQGDGAFPVDTLLSAVDDKDVGAGAAGIVLRLAETGFLGRIGYHVDEGRIREKGNIRFTGSFQSRLNQLEAWAHGEEYTSRPQKAATSSVPPILAPTREPTELSDNPAIAEGATD
jgi:hypothetical protein